MAVGMATVFTLRFRCSSRCILTQQLPNLTLAEMSLPSARPASLFEATPITLPISFIDVAPTSAIRALTSAVRASGVSCLGRNSWKTATWASSSDARS